MDPDIALKALDDAMLARDRDSVVEYADALIGWLEKGSFLPRIDERDWRYRLTREELIALFRVMRHIAEME